MVSATVGRRRALVELLAGAGHLGRGVLGCRPPEPLGGPRTRAARRPRRARRGAPSTVASSSRSRNAPLVLALAGGQQPPEHGRSVSAARIAAGDQTCRSGGPTLPPVAGSPPAMEPHYPRSDTPRMPRSTSPTRFAYLGPEGTFAEAALRSVVASSEGDGLSPSRASPPRWPPSGRVTPTPRSCRWRTPSRARCRPRWTGWPTAIRW